MAVKMLSGLQRGLDVLEAVARHQPVTGTDLAALLDLDRSALQRSLTTLHAQDWIRQEPETRAWTLGPRTHRLLASTTTDELRARARPQLDSLRDQLDETAFLALAGHGHVYVSDVADSGQLVRIAPTPGMVIDAELSAAVVAVAAFLPDADARQLVEPVSDRARLDAELTRTRGRGYAVNAGLVNREATSIAAPIFDAAGRPVGAIVVTMPTTRAPQGKHERIAKHVVSAAAAASMGRP